MPVKIKDRAHITNEKMSGKKMGLKQKTENG